MRRFVVLITATFRRLLLGLLTGFALVIAGVSTTVVVGALTPAYSQVSEEFLEALQPYGEWRRSPRYGDIWVPAGLPPD